MLVSSEATTASSLRIARSTTVRSTMSSFRPSPQSASRSYRAERGASHRGGTLPHAGTCGGLGRRKGARRSRGATGRVDRAGCPRPVRSPEAGRPPLPRAQRSRRDRRVRRSSPRWGAPRCRRRRGRSSAGRTGRHPPLTIGSLQHGEVLGVRVAVAGEVGERELTHEIARGHNRCLSHAPRAL